jgi:DNA processing protein
MESQMSINQGIITLLQLPNIGRKTVYNFLMDFSKSLKYSNNHKEYFFSDQEEVIECFQSGKEFYEKIVRENLPSASKKADHIIKFSESLDIKILNIFDKNYPSRLRKIPDPPPIVYTKGNLNCFSKDITIAVVGTRNPTSFGEKAAEKIGGLLARCNIPVVSGLAEGSDSFAQQGCVDQKGETIAVLAHGLDQIYPRQNENLALNIISSNGCLLSEYPPGMRPSRFSFVDRDRLQSGLSDEVIVIETGIKGGTMHTIKFCLEQKRILGCLKHSPEFLGLFQVSGNQKLILDNKAFPIYFDYFIRNSPNKIDVEDSIVSFIKKIKMKKNLDDEVYLKIENTFNEYITENNFSLAKDDTESSCKKNISKKKNTAPKKFAKSQKKLSFGE